MVDEVIARTNVTPKVVSVDDGYASAENKKALKDRYIEVVSINGAKGRALTSPADCPLNSPEPRWGPPTSRRLSVRAYGDPFSARV